MPPNPTMYRAFPSSLERTGPRQLTGRLVPYGETADVLDELPDGQIDIYREGFRPGAFGPQVNTRAQKVIQRIGLIHRHDGGLGYLGPVMALREAQDGLYGDIMIVPTKADDVAALLDAGVDELSIEFRLPQGNDHTEIVDGVRWRKRAHLDGIALEPKGAYRTAQVLAYRAEMDAQKAAEAEEQRIKAEEDKAADEEKARAEAAAEEIKVRAEKEAEAALERKRRFEEMNSRFDADVVRQREFVKAYLPGDRRNQ